MIQVGRRRNSPIGNHFFLLPLLQTAKRGKIYVISVDDKNQGRLCMTPQSLAWGKHYLITDERTYTSTERRRDIRTFVHCIWRRGRLGETQKSLFDCVLISHEMAQKEGC